MERFLENPEPYTPVLNGIDVVRFFEERKIVPGNREWGLKDPDHNRMFFFADEAALNHFYNQHTRYTDAALAVMEPRRLRTRTQRSDFLTPSPK
jgi:hypothetical protein